MNTMEFKFNLEKEKADGRISTIVQPKTKHLLQLAQKHLDCNSLGELFDKIANDLYEQAKNLDTKKS